MTSATAIRIADAPMIQGLAFRRLRSRIDRAADYAAMADVAAASNVFDHIPWVPTGESFAAEFEHDPISDPDIDVILAEIDGTLVGWAHADRAVRDDLWVHGLRGNVHPDWRRRGLGRALLHANIARARDVATDPRPAPPVMQVEVEDTETGALALVASEGFAPVRWFHLMRRPLAEPIPDAPLPDGLEIRPVLPAHHQTILDAENEAFRDHWGHREETPQDLRATLAQPELDAGLWQVAWDGDQVAGVVQNWIWRHENERLGIRRGWLERVSVRRAWRRRGLARALIARSLVLVRDLGMDDAMLGVDSDNPQGALDLYTSLGFELDQRSAVYQRPLDP
ncbi:MAG TPA: GNAT family N-acetyltransferase [Candidatus Limnocylindrales bacterium]